MSSNHISYSYYSTDISGSNTSLTSATTTSSRSTSRNVDIPVAAGRSLSQDFKRSMSLGSQSPPRIPTITKSAVNIEEDLLNALQCPVCFEYMVPPITLCENGHSICQDCKPKFHTCPICRRSLSDIRNITLENLARSLLYPCRYSDEGCTEKYNLHNINNHLLVCPYRVYDCLLEDSKSCCWKGKLAEFKMHMKTAHARRVSIFDDQSATCVVWEISYAGCFRDYTHIIFAFNEVFIYKKRFNVDEKKLYFTVQHIGLKANASRYRYKYKMVKNDEQQKISVSSVVHCEKDDMEAIMMSGHCVSIEFNTLVSYGRGSRIFAIMKSKT